MFRTDEYLTINAETRTSVRVKRLLLLFHARRYCNIATNFSGIHQYHTLRETCQSETAAHIQKDRREWSP
jgi:hypothetical protein